MAQKEYAKGSKPRKASKGAEQIMGMFFPSYLNSNSDVQKLKKKLYSRLPKS